ncbi:leucyl/phenylalanyl-tRNA--protein transferase [Oceanicola sp. 22II-s10i]|uniref:leucyl/phenylalanyl-tRNA--protein transferase n=1 Tax=Oceanicola sp. 22II-s10i TaxID=1317116 RepID=UPI000B525456|nr:leucyl/phenylalanyl-tRNA--protein transferase [Oceanicola sp. 22II-s10i]OWU85279.1 leucyl/phenylalanyl-tRNA--protein transferase [Oceanicola sp. 22II-s10i]
MKDHDGLTPNLLLHAYTAGIFPMAEGRDDPEIFWVDPRRRGIFPLDGFCISRSLARTLRRGDYRVTVNRDFAGVVDGCADRPETWINAEIARLYDALHDAGHAHSVEVRDLNGDLIGGTYGVAIGAAYFGESMFSRRRDASKIALAWLIDRLNRAGFTLFDTQFLTPHLASLGAIEISRADYQARLRDALSRHADFNAPALPRDGQSVLQRRTQMS